MSSLPSRGEFIAIVAMLFASIAFSIDAMLPAFPELTAQFSPDDPNRVPLIVTIFMLGMGLGTFFTGPLSDAFGRKTVVLGTAALYILSALGALLANSLEMLLVARFMQGLGAAGPRVVALAIVRDLYAGRAMARIMSFVMVIFTIVPALAPTLGAGLIWVGGWHAVFWAFAIFATLSSGWLALRLPETLAPEDRRPFRFGALSEALREMVSHQVVRQSMIAQMLCFGALVVMISNIQPIYDAFFDRAGSFPLWFGGIAIISASASLLNAALVMKVGMRKMVTIVLTVEVILSAAMTLVLLGGVEGTALFACFVLWQTSIFFMVGLTMGNLNALGMEPMGHIAGLAASVMGALGTVGAVILAVPVGLAFDGTPLPVVAGILVFLIGALWIMSRMASREEMQQPAE
ncbi:multidrug effflux MFS transporter [Mameliella alba]|uniref:Multidrug MFS transporter n=1 Tax=Mameliella alba TaxID=561184 RepID=A0A0B3S1E5_9RHOB|nr:multidrug effflux MFS transporter [Mameliella alba]KHQ54157.1 Multidrug MFS transporter [Mameliella alba]